VCVAMLAQTAVSRRISNMVKATIVTFACCMAFVAVYNSIETESYDELVEEVVHQSVPASGAANPYLYQQPPPGAQPQYQQQYAVPPGAQQQYAVPPAAQEQYQVPPGAPMQQPMQQPVQTQFSGAQYTPSEPPPPPPAVSPYGEAGNTIDDGDTDAFDYAYDPLHGDDSNDPADSEPDVEGQAPPTPKWHACRFQAKAGGVYDLRPLMRLARTLEEDWNHQDAKHGNTTYYLNVCANTMAVPQVCQGLAKKDPAPAYQVGDNGNCYYLGTLKTFKWKPIDSKIPMKGMKLFYQNGERCNNGKTRQVMFTFACSEHFSYSDGPLVVYETVGGCHYDVHWPNRAGCPSLPLMHRLQLPGSDESSGGMSTGGIFLMVLLASCCLYICGGCWYRRTKEGADGIEACPHHQFWCSLPAQFLGMCQGAVSMVTNRPSSRGYERAPTTAGPIDYGSSATMNARDDMF